jgi:hypothetical protein
MEKKNLAIGVPRRSIIYLAICGTGILAFVLGGIYPSYRNNLHLNGSIADIKARIEEQKVFFPLYQKLRQGFGAETSKDRPDPQKSGLSAGRIDNLPAIFGQIAANFGLEVSSLTPDVKSMADNPHFLLVRLALKGNLFDFRKFLIELANLPYLEGVEEVKILEGLDGKEYYVKVWLMIESARAASG